MSRLIPAAIHLPAFITTPPLRTWENMRASYFCRRQQFFACAVFRATFIFQGGSELVLFLGFCFLYVLFLALWCIGRRLSSGRCQRLFVHRKNWFLCRMRTGLSAPVCSMLPNTWRNISYHPWAIPWYRDVYDGMNSMYGYMNVSDETYFIIYEYRLYIRYIEVYKRYVMVYMTFVWYYFLSSFKA